MCSRESDLRSLKWLALFECAGGIEDGTIAIQGSDNLQANREASTGEAAWQGNGRLARQVERVGERGPVRPLLVGDMGWEVVPRLEGRDRHGRCHQQIISLMELIHAGSHRFSRLHGGEVLHKRNPATQRDHLGKTRIEQFPLFVRELTDEKGRTAEPVRLEGEQTGIEHLVNQVYFGTKSLEPCDCLCDAGCDFRVDGSA